MITDFSREEGYDSYLLYRPVYRLFSIFKQNGNDLVT